MKLNSGLIGFNIISQSILSGPKGSNAVPSTNTRPQPLIQASLEELEREITQLEAACSCLATQLTPAMGAPLPPEAAFENIATGSDFTRCIQTLSRRVVMLRAQTNYLQDLLEL